MKHWNTLEFTIIREQLADCALSELARQRCLRLEPMQDRARVERGLHETTQAKELLDRAGTPPLPTMTELDRNLSLIEIDALLNPEQLDQMAMFFASCRRMKAYLKRAESTGVEIARYGASVVDLSDIEQEIDRCIRNGLVEDRASQQLYDVRRKMSVKAEDIKSRLNALLRKNPKWFSESFIAARGGRQTLPVKKQHKHDVPGTVIEISNTGGTCFVEPAAVGKLQDELSLLRVEEDSEVRRVLYTLTSLIADALPAIQNNREAMEILDFLFAKAKLSERMEASAVRLTDEREMRILRGRHPLLEKESAVPLDFVIGGGIQGVVITGPNTGGKTIALKTVGLLSLMVQSGLHIPAAPESSFCLHKAVYCDIGDGQSISENLSTFSSHMTNILDILRAADENALVLLDELGSGTDPAEGMGIAVAVLEELRRLQCLFVATTHYPEIKEFAAHTPGLINARMAFDRESLLPLYRLEIGAAGESCALHIAKRLGMPQHMLDMAEIASQNSGRLQARSEEGPEQLLVVQPREAVEKIPAGEAPPPRKDRFAVGDSVVVYPQKLIGIVSARANEKGEVEVLVQGQKRRVNHKRLQIKVAASELYPDEYDMSIVLDSVANRKARRRMDKGHDRENVVVIEQGKGAN